VPARLRPGVAKLPPIETLSAAFVSPIDRTVCAPPISSSRIRRRAAFS
jgi:hypothetical protein